MTETLVAKQAVLETVQSERSSLLLQLERATKDRAREHEGPENENSTRVLLNITDDGIYKILKTPNKNRYLMIVILIVVELAKVTTGVSRRMRHAYSSLDSLNFRFGQALRRRPAARLVLFLYVKSPWSLN